MASIHPYRTKKGERRCVVRYRDSEGNQRSQAFSTLKEARAFKLQVERKRSATHGQGPSHKAEGRRFFSEAEVRQWLRSRHGAGR